MVKQPVAQFSVQETDHLWIQMPDGVRLAARLWHPKTDKRVPAILEYIPYRKSDMVRARDERNHPFLAAHGYAAIRVDMRGSGDSEGHMSDMYTNAELEDACHVINWLAAQSWCNGRVGMFGTSWGGTASLQAAANAPDSLKAVIAVCSTHDRFNDDIHYMGGYVLSDTLEWGATLPAILASPPTKNIGPNWQEHWRQRIESAAMPLQNWLQHDRKDDYWQHGSIIDNVEDLSVPILAVGGWSDRYSNSVMTLVDARPDMVWGVVGPWGHHYPDKGLPGPAIGFQQLALEWWDSCLKDQNPDELGWPKLRVWQREFEPPEDTIETRRGYWVQSGPAKDQVSFDTLQFCDLIRRSEIPSQSTATSPGSLKNPAGDEPLTISTDRSSWSIPGDFIVGSKSGDTGYFGRAGGLPLDQSSDDECSLVLETEPLSKDTTLYGAPSVRLQGDSSANAGLIAVRLNDVTPAGKVARISYGIVNLALAGKNEVVIASDSTRAFDVNVALHTTAYRLKKGHRLRVAMSSSYWPLIWSTIGNVEIQIHKGYLQLPCVNNELHRLSIPFHTAEDFPEQKTHQVMQAPPLERWNTATKNTATQGWFQPMMKVRYLETDTVFGFETRMEHMLSLDGDFISRCHVEHTMLFERDDGTAKISVVLHAVAADEKTEVNAELTALWNNQLLGKRHWTFNIRSETSQEIALTTSRTRVSGNEPAGTADDTTTLTDN